MRAGFLKEHKLLEAKKKGKEGQKLKKKAWREAEVAILPTCRGPVIMTFKQQGVWRETRRGNAIKRSKERRPKHFGNVRK